MGFLVWLIKMKKLLLIAPNLLYDELRTQELKHKLVFEDDYLRFCGLLRRTLKLAEYQ